MDEATQTPRSSDRNLIIYLGVLMIGYWLLRSILERFTGLSEGTKYLDRDVRPLRCVLSGTNKDQIGQGRAEKENTSLMAR